MEKRYKLHFIFIIALLIIFLFPTQKEYGYSTHTEDEGPDVSDTSTTWQFTYYSDGNGGLAHTNPNTGSSFKQDDWQVNETYGWHEWTYNGVNYVVMAAATAEGMEDYENGNGGSYTFIKRQPNIHYFHYGSAANNWNYSTFQFQFVDNNDSTVYNGIVLDTCELALDPSNENWGKLAKPANTQWLDVHVPLGYPDKDKYSKFNGKIIRLSSTGTFSSSSGSSKSSGWKQKLTKLLTEGFIFLADLIQVFLNELYTIETNYDSSKLTYSKSEITGDSYMKDQIQVEDDNSSNNKNTIVEVDISPYIDNEKGEKEVVYTTSTEIPVIPADIYSASIDQVNVFDIDFYDQANDNPDSFWKIIRNVVSGFTHIVIYLSAVLILVMLIWRSILLVLSSIGDNPQGASESKEIMDGLLKAICIIAGIYVFMTLMLYFYQEMMNLVLDGNDSIYLMRVNVNNVYSFNTNLIGCLKYMTLKSNPLANLGSSFLYLAVAIINLLWFGFMFARMLIIGGLTIVAPITAVNAMLGRGPREGRHIDNIFHFKNWMKLYLRFLWIPLIAVIVYKFILCIG